MITISLQGKLIIQNEFFCIWHMSNACLLTEIISNGGISDEAKEEIQRYVEERELLAGAICTRSSSSWSYLFPALAVSATRQSLVTHSIFRPPDSPSRPFFPIVKIVSDLPAIGQNTTSFMKPYADRLTSIFPPDPHSINPPPCTTLGLLPC